MLEKIFKRSFGTMTGKPTTRSVSSQTNLSQRNMNDTFDIKMSDDQNNESISNTEHKENQILQNSKSNTKKAEETEGSPSRIENSHAGNKESRSRSSKMSHSTPKSHLKTNQQIDSQPKTSKQANQESILFEHESAATGKANQSINKTSPSNSSLKVNNESKSLNYQNLSRSSSKVHFYLSSDESKPRDVPFFDSISGRTRSKTSIADDTNSSQLQVPDLHLNTKSGIESQLNQSKNVSKSKHSYSDSQQVSQFDVNEIPQEFGEKSGQNSRSLSPVSKRKANESTNNKRSMSNDLNESQKTPKRSRNDYSNQTSDSLSVKTRRKNNIFLSSDDEETPVTVKIARNNKENRNGTINENDHFVAQADLANSQRSVHHSQLESQANVDVQPQDQQIDQDQEMTDFSHLRTSHITIRRIRGRNKNPTPPILEELINENETPIAQNDNSHQNLDHIARQSQSPNLTNSSGSNKTMSSKRGRNNKTPDSSVITDKTDHNITSERDEVSNNNQDETQTRIEHQETGQINSQYPLIDNIGNQSVQEIHPSQIDNQENNQIYTQHPVIQNTAHQIVINDQTHSGQNHNITPIIANLIVSNKRGRKKKLILSDDNSVNVSEPLVPRRSERLRIKREKEEQRLLRLQELNDAESELMLSSNARNRNVEFRVNLKHVTLRTTNQGYNKKKPISRRA